MASRIKPKNSDTATPPSQLETEVHNGKTVNANSNFALLNVAPWLIASLAGLAIKRPTAVQEACIPRILNGHDVIGGSRTGSGKTVAFAVPILQKLFEDPMGIYAVVLTPTRELALQIFEQFKAISALHYLDVVLVTGGVEERTQALDLARRPHVVIATPGRLVHHISYSGTDTIAGLHKVKFLVLDEADRLLMPGDGSMRPDVETILDAMPPPARRQTCLFTATMTAEVMALRDAPRPKDRPPIEVCQISDESAIAIPPTLQQSYLDAPDPQRETYLHVLLQTPRSLAQKSIIVFCNRTKEADILERILRGLGHSVTSLHSAIPQSDRNSNLSRFRANASRILVATDVASRGLDIPEVGLVINYKLPRNPDDYIHRVGRTARAGRKGEAVSIIGHRDIELVHAIEDRVGAEMTKYTEEGVNIQTRVARDALKDVGIKRREVLIGIAEGRDVKGNRKRGKISKLQ